jgi:hypothetical protein
MSSVPVMSDEAVIFFSSTALLTANGNFLVVPLLHSVSDIITQGVAVLLATTAPFVSYPFTRLSIKAELDVFLEVFCDTTHKPVTDIPICCLFCKYMADIQI